MKRFLLIIAVVALLVPGALLAQDGISLEGLAERIDGLVEEVEALTGRVDAIEATYGVTTSDGLCVIGNSETIHAQTATKYLEEFDEMPGSNATNIKIEGVTVDPETGIIGIRYGEELSLDPMSMARAMDSLTKDPRRVIEYWSDCAYTGSSDWSGE